MQFNAIVAPTVTTSWHAILYCVIKWVPGPLSKQCIKQTELFNFVWSNIKWSIDDVIQFVPYEQDIWTGRIKPVSLIKIRWSQFIPITPDMSTVLPLLAITHMNRYYSSHLLSEIYWYCCSELIKKQIWYLNTFYFQRDVNVVFHLGSQIKSRISEKDNWWVAWRGTSCLLTSNQISQIKSMKHSLHDRSYPSIMSSVRCYMYHAMNRNLEFKRIYDGIYDTFLVFYALFFVLVWYNFDVSSMIT